MLWEGLGRVIEKPGLLLRLSGDKLTSY